MAKRTQKTVARPERSAASFAWSLLGAFALGVGLTWLVLRGNSAAPTPAIESFLPQASSQAANLGSSAPLASAGPPDVSLLAPAEAARTLGNWSYDQQDWEHAREHYERSIALGVDNADVRTDLGNCFRFLGQPQKALGEYQMAQRQNPQHENSLFNQISLYNDLLHDHAQAVTAAQEFIARFPQSPQSATARQLAEKPALGDSGAVKR